LNRLNCQSIKVVSSCLGSELLATETNSGCSLKHIETVCFNEQLNGAFNMKRAIKKRFKHSYETLADVGKRHYGDTNFCAVIAVAVLNDWSFGIAKAKLEKRNFRTTGKGVWSYNTKAVLEEHGARLVPIPADYFGKTLATLRNNVPSNGRYIVHVKGHVAAIRDGVLEDWSAFKSKRARILEIHKVEGV